MIPVDKWLLNRTEPVSSLVSDSSPWREELEKGPVSSLADVNSGHGERIEELERALVEVRSQAEQERLLHHQREQEILHSRDEQAYGRLTLQISDGWLAVRRSVETAVADTLIAFVEPLIARRVASDLDQVLKSISEELRAGHITIRAPDRLHEFLQRALPDAEIISVETPHIVVSSEVKRHVIDELSNSWRQILQGALNER